MFQTLEMELPLKRDVFSQLSEIMYFSRLLFILSSHLPQVTEVRFFLPYYRRGKGRKCVWGRQNKLIFKLFKRLLSIFACPQDAAQGVKGTLRHVVGWVGDS